MVPEIGQFALAMALALALVQSTVPMLGAAKGNFSLTTMSRGAAFGQFLFLAIAITALGSSFIAHDFTVRYVAENSNLQLPAFYRISAIWGGHEGSLLLWSLMIAGWGAALAIFSGNVPAPLRSRALAVMGMVSTGFLLFMILTSNPFNRLIPPPSDGADLNPLLQDPGLAIHPPLLYMGYVGFSVAFAFSVASMIEGRTDSIWMRWARPWTLMAWAFLTIGITLGSWWAYNELGWGGWWFWDPVENASLMPWLAGTALIHTLAVSDKRNLFKTWSVLLAVLAFALSLLGTFLVRSGVLTSVHAFASDPARGLFILLLLALVVGGSLALYAWRAPLLASAGDYRITSRETCLLMNSVFMTVAVFTVLLGTIYPLGLEALGDEKISIGPPYFNAVLLPLMMPAALIVGFAMFVKWRVDTVARILSTTWRPLGLSLAAGLALPWLLFDEYIWQAAVGASLAAWVALTTFESLRVEISRRHEGAGGLSRSRSHLGMWLAHMGIAVFILGVTFTSYYGIERDVRLVPGQSNSLGTYEFRFDGVTEADGPNYRGLRGQIVVSEDDGDQLLILAEKRIYPSSPNPLTEAGIDIGLFRDVYVSLGESLDGGSWSARLQVKPFIRWVWAGTALMALGGLVAASDRRYRPPRPATGV